MMGTLNAFQGRGEVTVYEMRASMSLIWSVLVGVPNATARKYVRALLSIAIGALVDMKRMLALAPVEMAFQCVVSTSEP